MSGTDKQTVLLTGAAGRVGMAFRRHQGDNYRLILADRMDIKPLEGETHEPITLDISDPEACQRACEGVDAIVHLAADPSPEADFYGSLLDNNIKGVYNIYRAAADQGVRRVVAASSTAAVAHHPPGFQPHTDSPIRPGNMYGATKVFAEGVGAAFWKMHGLTSFAVRVGRFDPVWGKDVPLEPLHRAWYVSQRDIAQLFSRCIEADVEGFHVVHGLSSNAVTAFDISSTRALVGYEPQDDGFTL